MVDCKYGRRADIDKYRNNMAHTAKCGPHFMDQRIYWRISLSPRHEGQGFQITSSTGSAVGFADFVSGFFVEADLVFGQQRVQFAGNSHLDDDVATAEELAFDV